MPPMDAGRLDRLVTLGHRTLTTNTQGERVPHWAVYATEWAQRLDMSGREFFAGGAMLTETVFRFRIRWRSDVVETDQLTNEGVVYNVNSISEIGRHEGLELFCTALI